jgi:hypothetical protein
MHSCQISVGSITWAPLTSSNHHTPTTHPHIQVRMYLPNRANEVAGVAPLQCGNDVSVGSNREKNELHKTRTTHTPSFGERPPSPPRSLSCSFAPLARLQCARTLHQCMLVQRLVQPITRSSGSSLLCASFSSHFHQWRSTRWPSLQHLIAAQRSAVHGAAGRRGSRATHSRALHSPCIACIS